VVRERATLLLLAGVAAAVAACSTGSGLQTDPMGSALAPRPPASSRMLHLEGKLEGVGWGLGPQLAFDGWIRPDGWLRADLRFRDEKGNPAHEVLIWGPAAAILFDRRKGQFVDLGEEAGVVDFHGGAFRAHHVLWLMLGRWIGEDPPRGRVEGRNWSARDDGFGVRGRFSGGKADEASLIWRGERVTARLGGWKQTPWGAIPRRMELRGSVFETPVKGSWKVEDLPVLDDRLLDPLTPMEGGNREDP